MAAVPVASRDPGIQVLKLRDDKMKFVLTGTDTSVANALRRAMMALVPCLAVDLVTIHENSSVLPDEFIAHRLGLVPLKWRKKGIDSLPQDVYPFPDECDCDFTYSDICPKCSIAITLNVENESEADDALPIAVTSRQLKIASVEAQEHWEVGHYVNIEESDVCEADDGIALLKLGPGQRIQVTAVARMGVGKVHAKYNPTATVSMRFEPDIRLNYDLLERVSPRDQKDFERRNQPGVFKYDETSNQLMVLNARKAANIDEIRKIGMAIAKAYGSPENLVSVSFVPEKFTFGVESAGGLLPEQIVASALRALVDMMAETQTRAQALPGGGM